MKALKCLTYEERLKVLKLQPLEKRSLRTLSILTHKILYNLINLGATHLFHFARRSGLRRLIGLFFFSRKNPQKTKAKLKKETQPNVTVHPIEGFHGSYNDPS